MRNGFLGVSVIILSALFLKFGFTFDMLYYTLFTCILVAISVIDIERMLIDSDLLLASSLLFLGLVMVSGGEVARHLLGALAGFAGYFLIYIAGRRIFKKEALGFGDVLLMAVMGLVLGIGNVCIAGISAFYAALLYLLVKKVIGRNLRIKNEIPFAPFICIGGLISIFFGESILNWYFM